jgi:UPF0716 family protein affecting phage T7 exclusion
MGVAAALGTVAAGVLVSAAGVLVPVAGVLVSAAGVLVPVVGAATEGLAPQPVKSKKSRRQGTVQKRFRGVVKIESFRGKDRRDFMDAPR